MCMLSHHGNLLHCADMHAPVGGNTDKVVLYRIELSQLDTTALAVHSTMQADVIQCSVCTYARMSTYIHTF